MGRGKLLLRKTHEAHTHSHSKTSPRFCPPPSAKSYSQRAAGGGFRMARCTPRHIARFRLSWGRGTGWGRGEGERLIESHFRSRIHSCAKILGHASYPSPALRAPSPLRGERDGVRGPFGCGSQPVSKLLRNHITKCRPHPGSSLAHPGLPDSKNPVQTSRCQRWNQCAVHRFSGHLRQWIFASDEA